jgi:hypothetical protein
METRNQLEQEQAGIQGRGTVAHVMNERPDTNRRPMYCFRGEYDQRRDEVKAGTPAVLPPMPEELPRNRLGFAQWLLSAGTSADDASNGQPLLAGALWYGDCREFG